MTSNVLEIERRPLRRRRTAEVYQLFCCHCFQKIEIDVNQARCNKCDGALNIQWLEGRAAAA